MASSFEKSVKGATKIKLAAPKSKYVEHILVATHAGDAGVAEVFRVLQNRLRDSTWTIVFKSLIIVHFMIREGEADVTLRYLITHQPQRKLAINHFTEVQTQGRNIRFYAEYLTQRAISYGSTKLDYVRSGEGRLKRLNVEKGLLRETESVQEVIKALVKCDFFSADAENDITLTALRLLTSDLLALFHAMNEGMINVLEHYFELSRPDAERALEIYRNFVDLTKRAITYFTMARQYELSTGVTVPKIKHAPTTLLASLEEYLHDPEFEVNRRRYIAEQEFKKNAKGSTATPSKLSAMESKANSSQETGNFPTPKPTKPATAAQPSKGPAPDLIDFFESIDQSPAPYQQTAPPQQQVYGQQQPFQMQQTGFGPQQGFVAVQGQATNPFGQPQQSMQTGAGFGVFTPQSSTFMAQQPPLPTIPQNGVANFQQQQQQQPTDGFGSQPVAQPQAQPSDMFGNQQQLGSAQSGPLSTNPFRQSMLPSLASPPATPFTNGAPRSSTNPFAKPTNATSGYGTPLQSPGPLMPTPTGTNPFARNPPTPATASPGGLAPPTTATTLVPNVTGSTNPFRQSAFVNQATGQGWQTSSQGTMGGLEHLDTIAVFPRPGQQNGASGF